jgi:hypothetical protein
MSSSREHTIRCLAKNICAKSWNGYGVIDGEALPSDPPSVPRDVIKLVFRFQSRSKVWWTGALAMDQMGFPGLGIWGKCNCEWRLSAYRNEKALQCSVDQIYSWISAKFLPVPNAGV